MPHSPILTSPFASLNLQRIPRDRTHTLQAWDAADHYLLDYLHQHYDDTRQPLILNDSFGALGLSLHRQQPVLVNDSFVSQQAIRANQQANPEIALPTLLDSLAPLPPAPLVIIKQPKNSRYFDYQLQVLNHYLPAGTPVVMGAMVKYLSSSFFKLSEQHLDGVHTTLARKKARLLIGYIRGGYAKPPVSWQRDFPDYALTLFDTPNVFAAGKIDIGSRFFLQHFPDLSSPDGQSKHIIDLGCGNGMLGLYALQQLQAQTQTSVSFVDESYHAIHAARCAVDNWLTKQHSMLDSQHPDQHPEHSPARFHISHCLQGFEKNTADVVLCNPPFHQQQSVGTHIARQMFHDSAHVLRPNGTLYVIGNRHLGYHSELKKMFNEVHTFASDKKFILLSAQH